MPQFAVGRLPHASVSDQPTRHDSVASTNSSAYSTMSSQYTPSRTSTVTSTSSNPYQLQRKTSGHKRGISDTIDVYTNAALPHGGSNSMNNSPDHVYRNIRQSLRPLPQPPSSSPSSSSPAPAQRPMRQHQRAQTVDRFPQAQSENLFVDGSKDRTPSVEPELESPRPRLLHSSTLPNANTFAAPDLQELQKSSTTYLRTLSKFAQNGSDPDFSLSAPVDSVVGLQNRRRLKCNDLTRNGTASTKPRMYGFGERNWMDKQRQFLQAYEYLCHIGEAKEWIEDIIHQPIPPIVELEEALRNGVTLAEIVQAFHPGQNLKIVRNPRLQFKYTDNIVLFFRFLEEVGLPELFRFELIDLYEKKNIPKVIYCIHALSWLLWRKGMVDFRIGNLVGQLQFQDHELEQTQRGLDKAGVSMPSFSGMGASFGAEPEPEPVETEEERIDRELQENEAIVEDFQHQIRGALVRIRLGNMMSNLWDSEDKVIQLQSMIRGDWSRQVAHYRLNMKTFATSLQAAARGFVVRQREQERTRFWQSRQKEILKIQSVFRARRARKEVETMKNVARSHQAGVKSIQAAIRGMLTRRSADRQVEQTRSSERQVRNLQASIRGMLIRHDLMIQQKHLQFAAPQVLQLQAAVRGMMQRNVISDLLETIEARQDIWTDLQARIRGRQTRRTISNTKNALRSRLSSISQFQAAFRGAKARRSYTEIQIALAKEEPRITRLASDIRGFLLRDRLANQYHELSRHETALVGLQSHIKGLLSRQTIGNLVEKLEEHNAEIVQLQACIRATLCRNSVGTLLGELDEHEESFTQLQAAIRGRAVRSRFAERKRFFQENMEKVVKIQSVIRAKIQGQAYKSLTTGKNPPVGTLKGFVHLLNDSDFDFEEEIEFEHLRKTVVQHVQQNEKADEYIQQLDIKIALLVKNKITLDEVVKHQRHFGGHVGVLLPNADTASGDSFDLKALNRVSRQKLEHYQELFFLLQTQPHYLAKLFRRIREQGTADKECERIKHLVLGLFGYAQKRREEYYLLKLITRSSREEIDCSASLQDYIRTTAFCNRIFAAYIKSPRDRKFFRDVLGQLIKEYFIDNHNLDLESDPMQIYLSAISNEELRTGQRSQRDPNVSQEQAIRDPETRSMFVSHMQDLRDITDRFFLYLEDNLHRLPFGVRYILQQTHKALLERFPGEDSAFVLQVIGQWAWRNYLQPALLEPEKYGVADRAITQEQKKNLEKVAKVLNQAAVGREFGSDNVYLQPLNNYIGEYSRRFGAIWQHAISIPSAEEHYDIDEFNDLYARQKPTVYVKMSDVFAVHQLVASEIATIAPNQDDILREALRELGSAKSNEAEMTSVSNGEIMLTLTPKYLDAQDPDADIKALFTETKRCVLYIIRIQAGSSLLEILVKSITPEDEAKWDALISEELTHSKRGAYSELTNTLDFSTLTYHDLKRIALENVLQLESIGRLTRTNQYQDLLNTIAIDIRTKHRRRLQRQKELESVKTTLQRLNEQAVYLEQQLKTYNDYIEQAMVTLQSKKGKKRFVMPFTKQWEHERELQRTGRAFKFGSYKYSARTLADKGVLVHWRGYTEQQWYRVDITISSNEVGVFTIEGSSGNMMIPGATAQIPLEDLLQAQYNNTRYLEFFEGKCLRVNVNLFLHTIMKKFYNE